MADICPFSLGFSPDLRLRHRAVGEILEVQPTRVARGRLGGTVHEPSDEKPYLDLAAVLARLDVVLADVRRLLEELSGGA